MPWKQLILIFTNNCNPDIEIKSLISDHWTHHDPFKFVKVQSYIPAHLLKRWYGWGRFIRGCYINLAKEVFCLSILTGTYTYFWFQKLYFILFYEIFLGFFKRNKLTLIIFWKLCKIPSMHQVQETVEISLIINKHNPQFSGI